MDGIEAENERGRFRLEHHGQGVVTGEYRGHAHVQFAEDILPFIEEVLNREGKLWMFVDASALHTYDSGFRIKFSEWLKSHRTRIGGIDMYTRSKLVAMAITVVNLASGMRIVAHTTYTGFSAARDAATVQPLG